MKNSSSYSLVLSTVMLIISFVFNGILFCLNNTQKNTFLVQAFLIPSNDIVHVMKSQKAKVQDQEGAFVNNIQVTLLEIRWKWESEVWETFDVWENSLNLIVTDWFPWYVSLLETETYKLSC